MVVLLLVESAMCMSTVQYGVRERGTLKFTVYSTRCTNATPHTPTHFAFWRIQFVEPGVASGTASGTRHKQASGLSVAQHSSLSSCSSCDVAQTGVSAYVHVCSHAATMQAIRGYAEPASQTQCALRRSPVASLQSSAYIAYDGGSKSDAKDAHARVTKSGWLCSVGCAQ